jgi:hypothetical protein
LPAARLIAFAFLLLAPTACMPNYRAFMQRADSLGAACNQAVAQFGVTPTTEARQVVLSKLKSLNDALIKTARHERKARRTNSVDLIDANRAFLETGRAWGSCSLEYNRVLIAIGERDTARHNYQGLLSRLTDPQFVAERRQIQLALDELDDAQGR